MIAKIWDSIVGHFYMLLVWVLDMVCGPAGE
jgi:nitrate reductase NapE component